MWWNGTKSENGKKIESQDVVERVKIFFVIVMSELF